MANTKDQLREPGEKNTQDVNAVDMTDPLLSAQPKDRDYSKYNANIITDIPGQIPDIPEVQQEPITVDFTKSGADSEEDIGSGGKGGGGNGGRSGSSIDHEPGDEMDPDEKKGPSKVGLTNKENLLIAEVVTGMGLEGLKILNDFLINRFSITEDHVKTKILQGEADRGILEFKIDIGSGQDIDIQTMLAHNTETLTKAFQFDKEEKERITQLISIILKEKNTEIKPEYALLFMLLQKYGIGAYQLYQIRTSTETLLNHVNQMMQAAREQHAASGSGGPIIEPKTEEDYAKTNRKAGRKAATTNKKGTYIKPQVRKPKSEPVVTDEPLDDGHDMGAESLVDVREPGEGKPAENGSRRSKRVVPKDFLSDVQDVTFEKVKD